MLTVNHIVRLLQKQERVYMMNRLKKALSCILLLSMLFSLFGGIAPSAAAKQDIPAEGPPQPVTVTFDPNEGTGNSFSKQFNNNTKVKTASIEDKKIFISDQNGIYSSGLLHRGRKAERGNKIFRGGRNRQQSFGRQCKIYFKHYRLCALVSHRV